MTRTLHISEARCSFINLEKEANKSGISLLDYIYLTLSKENRRISEIGEVKID